MSEVDDNYENETICIKFCGVCPSYPRVKGEILFCARGKSVSPKQKSGCNCGLCDIWNKYDLTDFYYCMKGEAKELRRLFSTSLFSSFYQAVQKIRL
ncbi:MAG: DUF2769 domain-containing protein [Thermodesulfovibrionales bacterium]|nr:DUF2769 domain-containing protein [Thermodesulfovibrionales bacterium]